MYITVQTYQVRIIGTNPNFYQANIGTIYTMEVFDNSCKRIKFSNFKANKLVHWVTDIERTFKERKKPKILKCKKKLIFNDDSDGNSGWSLSQMDIIQNFGAP